MNNNKESKVGIEEYNDWAHRFGRIGALIAIIYMLAIPTIISYVYDIFPPLSSVMKASVGILVLFVPLGISEILSYTPILGSASYLGFLTGNIMNLKVPCAMNAMKISDVEGNTPKGDAIAAVAIASSSIMTMVVVALGVILLVPLRPLLEKPVVQQATQHMLPALFGGMFLGLAGDSGEYKIKNKLFAILLPVIIVTFASLKGILAPGLEGVAIILMLPVTIISARVLWKKKVIQVIKIEHSENAEG